MIADDRIKTTQKKKKKKLPRTMCQIFNSESKELGNLHFKTYFLARVRERHTHRAQALKSSPEHLKDLPSRPEKLQEDLA